MLYISLSRTGERADTMSPSKSSLARSVQMTVTSEVLPDDMTDIAPVKLTTDLTQVDAMPSPALDLQDNLRQAWTAPAAPAPATADERKIPVGWALTAVLLGCGAFWACVALIVF